MAADTMGAPDKPLGRFIPREQVGQAAAWEFQSLAGAVPPSVKEKLLSDREQRAYERGHEDGYAAGHAAAIQVRTQHAAEMARVLDALRGRFGELESDGAEQLLTLSLTIARQVMRREMEVDRAAVMPALHEAVHAVIDQQAHPRVHMNPQDLAHLHDSLDTDGLLKGCRFIADPAISRGGCRVETGHSDVDATIESRWNRVLAAVGIDPRRAPREPLE
jgi:flagellar assembly protein FliH